MLLPLRIGTQWIGRVDAVDDQHVATRFLIIGLPLLPLESALVTGPSGIPLRLHGRSVLVAYARHWGSMGALLAAALAFWHPWAERGSVDGGLLGVASGCACLFAWSFAIGGLAPAEKRERQALKAVTGISIPPTALPSEVRRSVTETM